jgi:hypothetical protein
MMEVGLKGKLAAMASIAALGIGLLSAPAHAVPGLQLDIAGGFYDTTSETILTSADSFTLYALLDTGNRHLSASDTYYISIALSPMTTSTPANLGSFAFNGTTVNATSNMTYGVPPIELNGTAAHDGGDLAQHGTFPTYFYEHAFTFNSANTSAIYNTAETPGGIQAGSGLLYAAFTVDRALLSSPYQLHFDLYSTSFRRGDTDVNQFAPFSHDAGTTTRGVPEPSSLLLLGAGLAGIGIWRRKFAKG